MTDTPTPGAIDNPIVRLIAALATLAPIVLPTLDPAAVQQTGSALISVTGAVGALISAIGLFRHGQRSGAGTP